VYCRGLCSCSVVCVKFFNVRLLPPAAVCAERGSNPGRANRSRGRWSGLLFWGRFSSAQETRLPEKMGLSVIGL
jgi:hypothetical protein